MRPHDRQIRGTFDACPRDPVLVGYRPGLGRPVVIRPKISPLLFIALSVAYLAPVRLALGEPVASRVSDSDCGGAVATGGKDAGAAPAPAMPLRIMPVGDSITVGYTDNPAWDVPFAFGYRGGLYSRLTDAGCRFEFVGGSTEPWTGISGDPTRGGTVAPDLDLRDFEQDGHRGYGGASIGAITRGIAGWIAADRPDLILLLIGINGISPHSPAQLDALVAAIFAASPEVHLVVAQITPYGAYNQALRDYNLHIRDTLVPARAAAGFNISTVDLYSLFLTDPGDPTSIGAGLHSNPPHHNHPTNAVYDRMAEAWFREIERLDLVPAESPARPGP